MSFEEYPPLSEFYRMRRYMERSLSEIKYDIERNKRRAQELAEELATAERSLAEIDAYIKRVKGAD